MLTQTFELENQGQVQEIGVHPLRPPPPWICDWKQLSGPLHAAFNSPIPQTILKTGLFCNYWCHHSHSTFQITSRGPPVSMLHSSIFNHLLELQLLGQFWTGGLFTIIVHCSCFQIIIFFYIYDALPCLSWLLNRFWRNFLVWVGDTGNFHCDWQLCRSL